MGEGEEVLFYVFENELRDVHWCLKNDLAIDFVRCFQNEKMFVRFRMTSRSPTSR